MNSKEKDNKAIYKFTQNKTSLFTPTLGLLIIMMMYLSSILGVYLLLTRGFVLKLFLTLILMYQYLIADKNKNFIGLLKKLKIQEYFKSFTIVLEENLRESNSLFCFHPHGITSLGMGTFGLNPADIPAIENSTILATRMMRNLPFSGIISRWLGIQGINPTNFEYLLSLGHNLIINPGGFECATRTNNHQDKTFIKERKGFIKYALKYGYCIHPCYVFNENKAYYTFSHFEAIGRILNKIKLPGCLFYGKYFILPRTDIPLTIVVGKAINMPKIASPTKTDVEQYHEDYLNKLQELFQKYSTYGGSKTLEFI